MSEHTNAPPMVVTTVRLPPSIADRVKRARRRSAGEALESGADALRRVIANGLDVEERVEARRNEP